MNVKTSLRLVLASALAVGCLGGAAWADEAAASPLSHSLKDHLEQGRIVLTPMVGGPGGKAWLDCTIEDGMFLTGLTIGHQAGHLLNRLTPMYATPGQNPLLMYPGTYGRHYGGTAGARVMILAKAGYAVGGLIVSREGSAKGLAIVFMKIRDDGALDPKDTYESEWFGKKGDDLVTLGGDGRPVVGIYGNAGNLIDAIGLVQLR